MTMQVNSWQTFIVCLLCIFLQILMFPPNTIGSSEPSQNLNEDLFIEPLQAMVNSGENVSFTCFSLANLSFSWNFEDGRKPRNIARIVTGMSHSRYWSKIELVRVKRNEAGNVLCSTDEKSHQVSASLVVKGVEIGGSCRRFDECITERALCLDGFCTCPLNNIRFVLNDRTQEVCRELIYKLYDPCDFSEQCVSLVDPNSFCGPNGICTCNAWATDFNGKCVSKSDILYNRNQEMYRVGLIAVTCVIIVIVAVSLWLTLRRSCHEQISITPRRSIASSRTTENPRLSTGTLFDITADKPPSYDELVEIGDTVSSSPPNIKDALKNCITAKKLIRQASAPAGQLVSQTPSYLNTTQSSKSGCVSPVFTKDE